MPAPTQPATWSRRATAARRLTAIPTATAKVGNTNIDYTYDMAGVRSSKTRASTTKKYTTLSWPVTRQTGGKANTQHKKKTKTTKNKQKAKEIIAERLHKYEQIMGLYSTKFGITSANTRWGSCSGKNSIYFTWKLVMADIDVIDYVVVHEIAHIKEKNHGKNFWNLVCKYYPNYKSARVYLRNLSARIQQDNLI